jgi:glycosyltransferase involved in cell wall biosynthesis
VVIPAYNASSTIERTVRSVCAQTFENFEVVVIDDGSTDDTADLVAAIGDPRVRCQSISNGGVSTARNLGLRSAVGEYVAFLDADDCWLPTKLAVQVDALGARPEVGLCFVGIRRVDTELRTIGCTRAQSHDDYCAALLLYSSIVAVSSALVRKEAAESIGGFDPAFSQCADWDFWLRLCRRTPFLAIDELLVLYRMSPDNMSSDIALLERDTFGVLEKFYAEPENASYLPIRQRVLSNHWMICAGSYLHRRQGLHAIRCVVNGLRCDPSNARRPLALPVRWARRTRTRTRSRTRTRPRPRPRQV